MTAWRITLRQHIYSISTSQTINFEAFAMDGNNLKACDLRNQLIIYVAWKQKQQRAGPPLSTRTSNINNISRQQGARYEDQDMTNDDIINSLSTANASGLCSAVMSFSLPWAPFNMLSGRGNFYRGHLSHLELQQHKLLL
jgi:hypothetical protein